MDLLRQIYLRSQVQQDSDLTDRLQNAILQGLVSAPSGLRDFLLDLPRFLSASSESSQCVSGMIEGTEHSLQTCKQETSEFCVKLEVEDG
jgi:hypothetical protein